MTARLEVEEAFFRTTALPHGFSVKGGRFFSGVGYLNEIHAHAWDFIDQPLAYQAFFGGQFAQDGVQVKWLAPTDLFIEFGAETGNGGAFPGTRSTGNGLNGTALFAHVGGDIGDSIGWRAGVSWIDLDAVERTYDDVDSLGNAVTNAFTGSSQTWIADATLKWSPGGDARRNAFKLQAEYMQREEDGALAYDVAGAALAGTLSQQAGRLVCAGRVPVHATLACRPALRRSRRRVDAHWTGQKRRAHARGFSVARASDRRVASR